MEKQYLSIDIGGTNIKYGLIDTSGCLLKHGSRTTPTNNLDDFLAELFKIVKDYQCKISGIAISVPGKVDIQHAVIYHGGSLPFLDTLPLANILKNRFQVPVNIENDGKSTALGEYWQGNLIGKDNSAAIVLGTAVGGGLILDGHVREGAHLQAGEISFMINPSDNQRQVLGDQCSAVRLVARLSDMMHLNDQNNGRLVFDQLSLKQEPEAMEILTAYCRQVAGIILNIQAINDLTDFVIGGGISRQPLVTQLINQQYDFLLGKYPNIKTALTRPTINAAKFGNQTNLYGAMYSFLTNQ